MNTLVGPDRPSPAWRPRSGQGETHGTEATAYVISQQVRYTYPTPATHLRQRLMLIPPARHGEQRRLSWRLDSSAPARRSERQDRFGNLLIDLAIDQVDASIEFSSWAVVERTTQACSSVGRPHHSLCRATTLTDPGAELADTAGQLVGQGSGGEALAERICDWVAQRLTYQYGVTSITTSAQQACALGVGVCQDFAHIMLAVCRQAGLAARYVSGHLLGEGASHAWVEVLTPEAGGRGWKAAAFDPTHNRRAGRDYLTIATGRDYRDVAPTSGTCHSATPGTLSLTKQATIAGVDEHYRLPAGAAVAYAG